MLRAAVLMGMVLAAPPTLASEVSIASVASASGRFQVEVRAREVPLKRGPQTLRIVVTEAQTHAPATGLQLSVEPWMPAMGHGINDTPQVSAAGPGQFQVVDLDLFMPGVWELRLRLSGAATDQAVVTLKLTR
ncbi:FixH family protein [Melittangium boletus]|uniref:FixH family protein n=1 Tax=Melittangium boletus TaxID=83453 RepID=UPI003DA6039B